MPSLLAFVWLSAVALAALACGTMGALILARLYRAHGMTNLPERRAAISKALLHFALSGDTRPNLSIATSVDRMLLIETALDAAAIMRGPARTRLVALLREIGLDERMRRQARRGRTTERIASIEALRLFPDTRTLNVLKHAERSRQLRVVIAALKTRAELGVGADLTRLLEIAARPGAHKSPALYELIETSVEADVPGSLGALASAADPAEKCALLRALGETGKLSCLEPVARAARDDNADVRAAAISALGALGYADAAPVLAAATEDAHWCVRLKAAEALGRIGAFEHHARVARLLEDEVWWVRFRAEEALHKLNERGAAHIVSVAQSLRALAPQRGAARDRRL